MTRTVDDALAEAGAGRFQLRLMGIFGLVWAADAMQVIAVGFAAPSIAKHFGVEMKVALQTAITCIASAAHTRPKIPISRS